MESEQVPVLNIEDYRSGDSQRRRHFVSGLGEAYRDMGFVGITGHGIPAREIEAMYSSAWEFTRLSDDQKKAYHRPDLFGQRGYTPKGQEHAKGASVGDLKDFYHVGQELPDALMRQLGYPDNLWPKEVPAFRSNAIRVYQALESLGHVVLAAIFEGLGFRSDELPEGLHHGNSILRIAHYFPIEDPSSLEKGAVRAAAHGDINLITLLVGASADGLEILTREGQWLPVRVSAETIVVNVGDMLERLTNERLRSTVRRVVNPPEEKLREARLSMPFFMHPQSTMDLSVLDACIDSETPKRFPDITAGEFLDQRLKEIGLK